MKMNTPQKTLPVGYVLNSDERKYTILGVIGQGASCTAYLAVRLEKGLEANCILKAYNPHNGEFSEKGKQRFIDSAKRQNSIRQHCCLTNQTPPVINIFEANGTAYIDVSCYSGTTLDRLGDLPLSEYMRIYRTVANTVKYYHQAGYLCLDIKPENIFIMQNSPDDNITQLVEFIDFDSIKEIGFDKLGGVSYTRAWAAPEQLNISGEISVRTDIYTIGEMIFCYLFGRHSEEKEHRGFSKYPFDKCDRFEKYITRPDVQKLFTKLFRNTIRSSANNRFPEMECVVTLLDEIISELEKKEFIIPVFPPVSVGFIGRERELSEISRYIESSKVLFINGIGGIGKSTLVRKFMRDNRAEYDVMLYAEYDGDIKRTFADDSQIHISTIARYSNEGIDEYYERKLRAVKNICSHKKTLLIIDNYTDMVTKELSRIISLGYDTIIVTRNDIPKNSYPVMTVGAIDNKKDLMQLISVNLDRVISKEEKAAFEEIIGLTQGHTLLLELISRQIAAKNITVKTALSLIKKNGMLHYSDDNVGSIKDGEEVYATIAKIISALFDAENMPKEQRTALKALALLDVRGIETKLFCDIVKRINISDLMELNARGWIHSDKNVRVHPVIAETVMDWKWSDIPDEEIMEIYCSAADIYSGRDNAEQIRIILKNAKAYVSENPKHINIAMYYDMQTTYYDVMLNGGYADRTDKEQLYLDRMLSAISKAIAHMERAKGADSRQLKFYLSYASVMIRSCPSERKAIGELLAKAKSILKKDDSENICYFLMTKAWYFTLCDKNPEKAVSCLNKAYIMARSTFSTELEIIDIIYLPWANCLYYLDDFCGSISKLNEAVVICDKYSDSISYIDKKAMLLNCMLDVCIEIKDYDRCREIISEIDRINERFGEQGIYRPVSQNIREKVN